jgi:hypothetical protein
VFSAAGFNRITEKGTSTRQRRFSHYFFYLSTYLRFSYFFSSYESGPLMLVIIASRMPLFFACTNRILNGSHVQPLGFTVLTLNIRRPSLQARHGASRQALEIHIITVRWDSRWRSISFTIDSVRACSDLSPSRPKDDVLNASSCLSVLRLTSKMTRTFVTWTS